MRKRTPERTEMQEWVRLLHDSRVSLTMSRVPATEESLHTAIMFVTATHQGEHVELTQVALIDYVN